MRLLFITTRSPLSSLERDGGTTFATQLIRHLAPLCSLEILFLREHDYALSLLPNVKAVYFLSPDTSIANRFLRRMNTAASVEQWIGTRHPNYDAILIQHVSGGFGFAGLPESARRKMVIFPMFTGVAYTRSGEVVPEAYLAAEKRVLLSAGLVICPSHSESNDLVTGYGLDKSFIRHAPFGLDLDTYRYCPRILAGKKAVLLYVATIKIQKNQLDCIPLAARLLQLGIDPVIHLAGGIGDSSYHARLMDEIGENNFQDRIIYHGLLDKTEIAGLAAGCHFSISTAHWETFGIAMLESLAMGLPVLVYGDIDCLWEQLYPDLGCIGVERSPDAMAWRIASFYSDPAGYASRSSRSPQQVAHLAEDIVMKGIFHQIKKLSNACSTPGAIIG